MLEDAVWAVRYFGNGAVPDVSSFVPVALRTLGDLGVVIDALRVGRRTDGEHLAAALDAIGQATVALYRITGVTDPAAYSAARQTIPDRATTG